MTFRLKLKRVKKDKFNRIKFDLNKLKSPSILDQFNSIIGGKFNSLINLKDTEFDVDEMTIKFNNVLYETATETIKKSWMNERLLALCDERRKLKKEMKVNNSSTEYRRCNKKVRKEMKKAKEKWIENQCSYIEDSLAKNNSKKAFKIVKELTYENKGVTR